MKDEFKIPGSQLYRDSLLLTDDLLKELLFGKQNPQPITIYDISGQQHLGELHRDYKVLSGVGTILKSNLVTTQSTIFVKVQKSKGVAPSVILRVNTDNSNIPTGMFLGLHHKASGALRIMEGKPFNLEPKRLKTHAFVCGMTGSGKTVITKALIEETLSADIPVVVIDLKGDLASLGIIPLALGTNEFAQFCKEEGDVKGMEYARALGEQEKTKTNLLKFGITEEMSKEFASKIDVKIFTPGANFGIPLSLANQLTPFH